MISLGIKYLKFSLGIEKYALITETSITSVAFFKHLINSEFPGIVKEEN